MKTVVIYGFMTRDLKLKGLELLLFALVYSFAQFGSLLYGHVSKVIDFLGCSRSQYYKVRQSLVSKGLIYVFPEGALGLVDIREFVQIQDKISEDLSEAIRLAHINIYSD